MAVEDGTLLDTHNQKRDVNYVVSKLLTAVDVDTDGITIANLPDDTLVVSVGVITTVVSAAADDVAVDYNGAAIEASLLVDALGFIVGVPIATAMFSSSGGAITIKDGAQVPDANWRGYLVVGFIEIKKHTGNYISGK